MRKKWFKGSFALLLALTMTACAATPKPTETGSNSGTGTGTGTGTASEAPAVSKPLDLSIMLISFGTSAPPDSVLEKEVEKQTNTNLNLTWVPYNEYESRQNVGLASGDLPNLVQLLPSGPQLYTSVQASAIDKKVFHDLTEYIKDPTFAEKYPNLGEIPQSLWDKMTFNGGIYAIPRNIEPETFTGLWMREDLLNKAGLTPPTTVDELAETIIQLSDPENGIYGFELDGAGKLDSATMKGLAASFTGIADWGVNDQGDFVYRDFTPGYKDFLAWFKKLYDAKGIHPEFALGQKTATLSKGTAAAHFHRWHAYLPAEKPYSEFEDSVPAEAKAVLVPPVKGPKMSTVEANRGFWTQTAISSKVSKENIPQILSFLDWMASDDSLKLFLNGVEGIHYEMKDGAMVKDEAKTISELSLGLPRR
jgi:putative aldouronate transport system substrate-binding protein